MYEIRPITLRLRRRKHRWKLHDYTREIKKRIARWDAYLHVPDPDALAAEFSSRNVESFRPLENDDDGLRGFEVKDADGYMLFFGRPRS